MIGNKLFGLWRRSCFRSTLIADQQTESGGIRPAVGLFEIRVQFRHFDIRLRGVTGQPAKIIRMEPHVGGQCLVHITC